MPGLKDIKVNEKQTFTREEKLAIIRSINEDMKKAFAMSGKPAMTEEQMIALAEDEQREKEYNEYFEKARELEDTYVYQGQDGYKTPTLLWRSRIYLFNPEKTEDDIKANKELQTRLSTDEGFKSYVKELYDKLMAIDDEKFYLDNLKDKAALFGDEKRFYQFLFELPKISDSLKRHDPPLLTQEEIAKFSEKVTILQAGVSAECDIRITGNPYHMFFPEMDAEAATLLFTYYRTIEDKDKYEFINKYQSSGRILKNSFKFSPTAMAMLREAGLVGGTADINVTYQCFDEKGNLLSGRGVGIEELLQGNIKSLRVVKTTKSPEGTTEISTTLDCDSIVRRYTHEFMEKHQEVENQRLNGLQFSEDQRTKEVQRALIQYQLSRFCARKKLTIREVQEEDFQRIASGILNGTDPIYKYVMAQPSTAGDQMIMEMLGDDKAAKRDFALLCRRYTEDDASLAYINDPGAGFLKSTLAPKVDSSEARRAFSGESELEKELTAFQDKIDAIELPTPDNYTEEDVTAIAFSYLYEKENLRDSYIKARTVPGSNLLNTEPVSSGGSMIFTNGFISDERPNMHVTRMFIPGARQKAKEALENIQKGDCKETAETLKDCFDRLIRQYRYTADQGDTIALGVSKMLLGVSKVLEKPEFANLVNITEEQKEIVKLAEVQSKLAREMKAYEVQIDKRIHELKVARRYLGQNSRVNASSDPELTKAFVEYNARVLYFRRLNYTNANYVDAARVSLVDLDKVEEACYNRPLNRMQKSLLENPDQYMEYMKSQVAKNDFKPYARLMDAYNEVDLEGAMTATTARPEDKGFNTPYIEKWHIGKFVKDSMKAMEGRPQFETLYNELKNLPCITEADDLREISGEEQERRAGLYRQVAGKIAATKLLIETQYGHGDEVGAVATYDARETAERIIRAVEKMERSVDIAKQERSYEREAIARAHTSPEKTVEEFQAVSEQYVEKEKALHDAEMDSLTHIRYGRPTKETYLDMIGKLIDNAEKRGIKDPLFDGVVKDIKETLGSGTEGLEFLKISKELDKIESELSEKLLDDDSDALREKYAFVTNLMARVEGYLDTPDLNPEAESVDSVYADAFKRAEQRINNLAEEEANIDAQKMPAFKKLVRMAKESMENIREAIANLAFGRKQEGLETLRSGEDMATLAVYQTMETAKEDSATRGMLEASGAQHFVDRAAQSDAMKNNCKDLDIKRVNEVLTNCIKLGEFLVNKEPASKDNEEPQLHMQQPQSAAKNEGPALQ